VFAQPFGGPEADRFEEHREMRLFRDEELQAAPQERI